MSFQKLAVVAMGYGPARPGFSFALDASAEPPVLWIGRTLGTPTLLRCEDRGGSFSDLEPAKCFASPRHSRPASDPTHRLVLCGNQLLDEATGRTRKVSIQPGLGNNQGTHVRLDRDGNFYASPASGGIWKCGPDGKRIPFPATANDPQGNVYMMECVKPAGQPYPEEIAPHATDRMVKHWHDWIYGSIVKFPPGGGNIWLEVRDPAKN